MINRNGLYAVIGASNNEEKYGYKVFKDLKKAGYNIIPINPHEEEIVETKAYKTLHEYQNTNRRMIDTVIFVVPPEVTEKVLLEVQELGIQNVRMQPGSESLNAIEFCKHNKINCTHNACIMIEKLK